MNARPRIPFEQLASIISYDALNKDLVKDRWHFMSPTGDSSRQYDQSAHMRFVQHQVDELGIGDHISVVEQTVKVLVPETNETYFSQYKITVRGLTILTGRVGNDFSMHPLPNEASYPPGSKRYDDRYNGGFFLEFRQCEFLKELDNSNYYCVFNLGEHAYLKFHECRFDGVDLYAGSGLQQRSVLDLQGNRFENRHVTIVGGSVSNFSSSGWKLRPEIVGQVLNAKALEDFVNREKAPRWHEIRDRANSDSEDLGVGDLLRAYIADKERIHVNAEHLDMPQTNAFALITENKFTTLKFDGLMNFHFVGHNEFVRLESEVIPPFVSWGQYQSVDKARRYGWHHKSLFVRLKQRADAENDAFQSMILQREIRRCERAIISGERIRYSWQDRFIYWFSGFLSSYGTSWARPLVILTMANAAIASLGRWMAQGECQADPKCNTLTSSWLDVYAELFYPLAGVGDVLGMEGAFFSVLNVLHKAMFAVILYELVKTFRRFGRSR